ncbi:glycosyl transferase [Mesobacillus campisalis]|uniref:Glycosyl transferase n=1 Tax=Mesobacillus campisalis TaxID=1408103 RepID=A0A0M2SPZ6_9BACI|nr:glycosyltransferase family 4 protein [Mesobacillus campisalis]KKK36619.1 glycosyl transferase [Mesobacillus campisalis]
MKLLFVTTISDTVNAFLVPHIRFLIEQGNKVGVAFNIIQEVNPELLQLGCKVHQVDFQRNPLAGENLSAYRNIREIIMTEEYELVHVHTPVASFLTRLACRNIRKVKVLYTAHGFHFFKGAPKKNWAVYYTIEKIVARWTDGVITMNGEDFEAAKGFKLRKSNSIYKVHGIGLDLKKFRPTTNEQKITLRREYGYNAEEFILIYAGELSYRKHQDLLIKAISIVKEKVPRVKLLLAGDGDRLEEYKELTDTLGVGRHVDFLGYRKDIQRLLAMADLAISTSRQEGLPVNVMEAMATGLPLIVTDCRGNRDLVTPGKNGFVVGVDDVEACAKGIIELYYSKELRMKFAQKSRDMIEKYSLNQVIGEMKEIYSKHSVKC